MERGYVPQQLLGPNYHLLRPYIHTAVVRDAFVDPGHIACLKDTEEGTGEVQLSLGVEGYHVLENVGHFRGRLLQVLTHRLPDFKGCGLILVFHGNHGFLRIDIHERRGSSVAFCTIIKLVGQMKKLVRELDRRKTYQADHPPGRFISPGERGRTRGGRFLGRIRTWSFIASSSPPSDCRLRRGSRLFPGSGFSRGGGFAFRHFE